MECLLDNCHQIIHLHELTKHLQGTPHNKTRGDEINCFVTTCDKSYTTVKSLTKHMQIHHSDLFLLLIDGDKQADDNARASDNDHGWYFTS